MKIKMKRGKKVKELKPLDRVCFYDREQYKEGIVYYTGMRVGYRDVDYYGVAWDYEIPCEMVLQENGLWSVGLYRVIDLRKIGVATIEEMLLSDKDYHRGFASKYVEQQCKT